GIQGLGEKDGYILGVIWHHARIVSSGTEVVAVQRVEYEALIPHGKGRFDQFLDGAVDVAVLGRVKVVDVACELHAAVIPELDICRQPLIDRGPARHVNTRPADTRSVTRRRGVPFPPLRDHLTFASPFINGIVNTNDLLRDKTGAAI